MNLEQKDLVLSCLIGDGSLNKEGYLSLDHSVKQESYLFLKKSHLDKLFNKDLSVYYRSSRNTKSIHLWDAKEIKSLRSEIYLNGKKSIRKILELVQNKERALAYWIFDDGQINKTGLRICTCDSSKEELDYMQKWFLENFNLISFINYDYHKDINKSYPFLTFHKQEAAIIWTMIKKYAESDVFLTHKFRNFSQLNEREYNLPTSPRVPVISNRECLNLTDEQVISIYKEENSLVRTAKKLNVVERIIKNIVHKNNQTNSKGHHRNIR